MKIAVKIFCFLLPLIIQLEADDPMIVVDSEQPSEETRLPNSHSAALVMAFIFLCVLVYGAYRLCKQKCGRSKQQLTVAIGGQRSGSDIQGLEQYREEREAYLAIYGPKNIKSVSGIVSSKDKNGSSATTKLPC